MRVAIIHDHFLYLGGAERVLFALLKMYPSADVYMAFATPQNVEYIKKLTSGKIFTSPFNKISLGGKIADWYKPLLYLWWENLDLSSYDLVISSSHSFSSKSVVTKLPTFHISYIHTPPRYLYNEYNETSWTHHPIAQALLSPLFSWVRHKDYAAAQRPNALIANSKTVQQRIKRYYGRESIVIYPPIRIPPKTVLRDRKPTYFLCVSRLVKQKGIGLAVRTCNAMNVPLVIVGTGPQERYLRSIAGPTVTFYGFVPDDQMGEVYRKAKAVLFYAIDEDFGLVPVEAMAHGVPVVGYGSGGVRETVVDGKTGILFSDYSISGLQGTMHRFSRHSWSPHFLRRQAEKFSEKKFMKQMKMTIKDLYE